MVQLEEVEDDELNAAQPGPKTEEDEWDTETGNSHPPSLSFHPNNSAAQNPTSQTRTTKP